MEEERGLRFDMGGVLACQTLCECTHPFCSGTGKAFYALHIWRIFKRKDFRDAGSRPAGRCFEKAGGKSVRRAR